MKKKILLFPLLLVFFLHAPLSVAAENLYATEVAVADVSPEARKAAIRQAYEQVLVKASGYRSLKGKSGMQDLLKHAENHVQQFRYKTIPGADEEEDQRRLWVAFEKRTVQKALATLGLSVWEQGRPQVLIWLAQEQKGKRRLVDSERDTELLQVLKNAASRRGLPLLMPLMDLQDQSTLRVSDIWTGDRQGIEKASSRYGSQVVLAGRLREKGGNWEGRWTLFLPDSEKTFSSHGADEGSAAAEGLDKVMDWLASRYVPAVDSESAELVKVRFLNIRNLQDYSLVMGLLESLDALSGLVVEESQGDQLLVRAQVRGGRDILVQRLSLETDLTPLASVPDEETSAAELELTYRLR
jgi:hypothetical protein